MPFFEASKSLTLELVLEADSLEEAKRLAAEAAADAWIAASAEESISVQEIELPF